MRLDASSVTVGGFRYFQHHTNLAKVTRPKLITSQPASIQHSYSLALHVSLFIKQMVSRLILYTKIRILVDH